MSIATQPAFAHSDRPECTPFAHSPACNSSCGLYMLEQRQGTPDIGFAATTTSAGAHAAGSTGEAAGGWWAACQSQHHHTFPSYSYNTLNSTDNITLSSTPSVDLSASPVSLINSHPHALPTPFGSRHLHTPSLVDTSSLRAANSMSDLTTPGPSHNAPLPSPSSANSSDGASSPKSPPLSTAASVKQEYGPHNTHDGGHHIGFPDHENTTTLMCNNEEVTPDIKANCDRNIFFKEKRWTCYRRNYLFVQCSYNLTPCIPGAPIYVEMPEGKGKRMVQALGVKLAAVMDNDSNKDVGLVQQTPKRDRGPQMNVRIERLAPSQPGETPVAYSANGSSPNSPYLPLQQSGDSSKSAASPPTGTHTFERIQFKQATANNGRRRAQQQFYYLLVELHADIRKKSTDPEEWVKVAHRSSEPMVVRGRSPGHYKDSTSSSQTSQGGSGGGYGSANFGYGAGSSGMPYGMPPSSSHHSRGSMTGASPGGYNIHSHTLPSTPSGWGSSSAMSMKSPASVIDTKPDFMTEQEAQAFDHTEGYRWLPYAASGTPNGPGPGRSGHIPRFDSSGLTESSGFATTASPWAIHSPTCSRFQGLETSQGYYADIKAAF